jgi:hypothetical protein
MTRPGQLVLIEGERTAGRDLMNQLADVFDSEPCSITEAGLTPPSARGSKELLERLGDAFLLHDIEALCWHPWLQVDVPRFLRAQAQRAGVVALWPGQIRNGAASFSAPGRRDHVAFDAAGFAVLRPVETRFPDEAPFTLERIPG